MFCLLGDVVGCDAHVITRGRREHSINHKYVRKRRMPGGLEYFLLRKKEKEEGCV